MRFLLHFVHEPKTALCAVIAAGALLSGCASPPAPGAVGPRAMVEDGGVRSVFYPEPLPACRTVPCPGRVPAEYLAVFKRELVAAGFHVVDVRGYMAPVMRIRVDHVATTPTECDMRGVVYVADNEVEVKRSFVWREATTLGRVGAVPLSADTKGHVLRTCLGAFAASVKDALATPVSPEAASMRR